MELKYIFFRKLPFCRFMHSLRKNENISIWAKRIPPQQNKLLPFLPGSSRNKFSVLQLKHVIVEPVNYYKLNIQIIKFKSYSTNKPLHQFFAVQVGRYNIY